MPTFADAFMTKYLDPAEVDLLLVPAADPAWDRVRSLLEAVYELRHLDIEQVSGVEVLGREFQVPVREPLEARATWESIVPASERGIATLASPRHRTWWVGMELDTRVEVKLSLNAGALESILSEDLSGITNLQDFAARFDFIDMPAFLRQTGASTMAELRTKLPRRLELGFEQTPPFDPDAPGRSFRLSVCVLFREDGDLAEALRQAKAARAAVEAARPHASEHDGAGIRTSSAWMVVLPDDAELPAGVDAADVQGLFAAEGIVATLEATS